MLVQVSTEKSTDNKLQLPLAQTHKHSFHKSTLTHCIVKQYEITIQLNMMSQNEKVLKRHPDRTSNTASRR
jgi:hypothetical protein